MLLCHRKETGAGAVKGTIVFSSVTFAIAPGAACRVQIDFETNLCNWNRYAMHFYRALSHIAYPQTIHPMGHPGEPNGHIRGMQGGGYLYQGSHVALLCQQWILNN